MPEKFQKGKRHAIATFEDVFHEPGNHDAAAIQSHIYRERFESMYQEKLASIQEEYKEVIASSEDKHHLFDDMHDKPFAVIRTFVDKHIRSFTYRRTLFEKTYEDPYRPGEIIQKTEWGPAIDDFLADQSRFQELYNAFHNVLIEEDQNIRSELEHRKQKRHSNNLSRLPLLHK